MLTYMLDTGVCIQTIRDRPAALRPRFNAEADRLCISTVTLAELLFGAAKSQRPERHRRIVSDFAARLEVLPFDPDAAAQYADIRADLERRGTPIGAYDLMIAGHARSRGLVLVTHNTRAFGRVDGLRTEDWIADSTQT